MNINTKNEIVTALVVGAVLIVGLGLLRLSNPAMQGVNTNPETAANTPANTPGPGKATGPSFPSNALSPTPDKTGPIHFITPPAGDRWPQQSQNTISWNHGSGSTGQLVLVNASTKKFVGVILDQVGPDQTYYAWNTRDLTVSRTSAAKITVPIGNYMIVFSFDQNQLPTVTSPTFTIVPPLPKP